MSRRPRRRRRLEGRAVIAAGVLLLFGGLVTAWWTRPPPPPVAPPSPDPTALLPAAPEFVAQLGGRLEGPAGQPVDRARLRLQRLWADGTLGVPHQGGPDQKGRFFFTARSPGTYRLVIEAPGLARQVRRVTVLTDGDQRLGTLRLARERAVAGQVVDGAGRPLPGVTITAVSGLVPAGRALEPPHVAHSDVQGRFSLSGLAPGRYRLRAAAEGFAAAVKREVEAPTLDVRLTLRPLRAVLGRVLRKGQPVAGATVSLVGSGAWPPRRVRTDEGGQFIFSRLPEGIYELRARQKEWVSRPSPPVDVLGGGQPPTVTLHLLKGEVIRGRVRDAASGKGVAGARLIAARQTLAFNPHYAQTDEQGIFRLGPLLPDEYRVTVEREGYLPRRGVGLTVLPLENPPLKLRLRPGATLAGVVVDDTGRPVAGARLELVGRAVGSFIADRDPAGVQTQQTLWNQLLRAMSQTPAVEPEPVEIPASLGVMTGPVPLVPGGDQLGDLTGGQGLAPAEGPAQGFVTDDQGRFRIRGVPPGKLALVVRHPDYVRHRTPPLRIGREDPGREDLRVQLRPGITLEAEVVDEQRQPVPGAQVAVSTPQALYHHTVRVTDAQGRFRIAHLVGELRIELRAPGFVPRVERLTLGEHKDHKTGHRRVRLSLERASCRLAGRVLDRRKLPVIGARLQLESLSAQAPDRAAAVTGDGGAFTLEALGRIGYRVTVRHEDHPLHHFELRCPAPPVRWTLGYGGGIAFEVRDARTGSPVPVFHYALRRAGQPPREGVGSAGRVELVPIAAGRYTLEVRAQGYATAQRTVRVKAAAHPRRITRRGVVLRLQETGAVSGWVRDPRGLPVRGAKVTIAEREGRTDRKGRFRLEDVPVGTHELRAEHPERGQGRLAAVSVRGRLETRALVVDLTEDPARRPRPDELVSTVKMSVGVRGGRLVVTGVPAGGRAEQAGVVPGDELVSVAGGDLEGLGVGDAEALLRGPSGTPVVLRLRRGGRILERVVERELR